MIFGALYAGTVHIIKQINNAINPNFTHTLGTAHHILLELLPNVESCCVFWLKNKDKSVIMNLQCYNYTNNTVKY